MNSPRSFVLAVTAVIAVAIGLAAAWAVRTPYFLQPDERAHLDYAFAFFDAGRPFRTQPATAGTGVTAQERYVDAQIGFRRLRYDPLARVRSDYGSKTFIADFDARAPRPSNRIPPAGSHLPYVSFLYPALYYVLVATAMRGADRLTHGSLWSDLLAARSVGIVLLALTLIVSARIFLMLRFSRLETLLALVCIGWLPLTSWVAGYVQPDNLSFALVTVILWFGLRWQRSGRFADALAVAVFLGLLFFTKQHYALCCWVAFLLAALPRLASKMASRPIASGAVLLVVPELCFKASFLATYSPGLGFASNSFARVSATLSPAHVRVLLGGVLDGISSAFFGGESFQDYWLRFGERGETLFPARIYHLVSPLVLAAMLACFVLVGAGRLHVVRRILRVFRKRSFLAGLRLTTSSLPLNIYVITTCVLTFAFVQSNEVLWLEGRYWLPLIVPLIVLGSRLGDAASPPVRPLLRRVFLGGVAAFCAVSALFGIGAIGRAYYQPAAAVLTFDPMANIIAVRRSGEAVTATAQVSLRRGESIDITGYAIDPRTGFPARSVFARIDDGARLQAKVGLPLPLVENAFSDDRILDSGFELRLRADRYGLGTHTLRLYVAGVGLSALPLRDKLGFRVM